MGLKNELLNKKEKLQIAVDTEDLETVADIVNQWITEGWTYVEVCDRCKEWTGVEPHDLDEWDEAYGG